MLSKDCNALLSNDTLHKASFPCEQQVRSFLSNEETKKEGDKYILFWLEKVPHGGGGLYWLACAMSLKRLRINQVTR